MQTCVGWPNGVVPSAARLFSKAFAYLVMKRQLCSFLCQAYRLCTEAYLANGRDGYGVLTKAKVIVSVSSIHRLYLVLTEFETGLFCSFFLSFFVCVSLFACPSISFEIVSDKFCRKDNTNRGQASFPPQVFAFCVFVFLVFLLSHLHIY